MIMMNKILTLCYQEDPTEVLGAKPVIQFPTTLEENPIDRYKKYKGLRQVTLLKADTGLGIMIIEGKHPEAGTGVFISDLQADLPSKIVIAIFNC